MRQYRLSSAVATAAATTTKTSSASTQQTQQRHQAASAEATSGTSSSPAPLYIMKQSTISPSASLNHIKTTPFQWVLNGFIERGASVNCDLVVNHPDAPHPLEILRELLYHVSPGRSIMIELLKKATDLEVQFNQSAAGIEANKAANRIKLLSSGSKQQDAAALAEAKSALPLIQFSATMTPQLFVDVIDANPLLANDTNVLSSLVAYLLSQRLWERAVTTFLRIPPEHAMVHMWQSVLRPLRKGFFRDYVLLGQLMSPEHYPKNRFVLSVEATSELLSNAGLVGQFSPIVAANILDRYLAFVAEREKALKARTRHQITKGAKVEVHPTPFLIFFGIVAAQKHPTRKWCYLHWQICWSYFQVLNTKCPKWFESAAKPEEAEHLCKFLLATITNGANPWLTLNVARQMAKHHIVDGVDIAIWMLHRLSPMHYPEDARVIAKKLFTWLIDVVGIHASSKYEKQVLPAARVLINLGMHSSLSQLHSLVFDNLFSMSPQFKEQFVEVFEDLVCPMCNTMLESANVHVERSCNNCLYSVPAKERALLPSFSAETKKTEKQMAVSKQRAKERGKNALGVIRGSMKTLSTTQKKKIMEKREQKKAANRGYTRPPPDAAEVLKRTIFRPLVPGQEALEEAGDGVSVSKKPMHEMTAQEVHSQLENKMNRLKLSLAAREDVLRSRRMEVSGKDEPVVPPKAELPTRKRLSPAPESPQFVLPPKTTTPFESATPNDGSTNYANQQQTKTLEWNCLWCQEVNKFSTASVNCTACGAETGPAAGWRQFRHTQPPNLDIMAEIRARIHSGVHDVTESVVAGHFLLLFRKVFLIKATADDFRLFSKLIQTLVLGEEKVLAAVVYTRILPPKLRKVDKHLHKLAALFHANDESRKNALRSLTDADLLNDRKFYPAVFTASTCKVCFGNHAWQVCPIITRNFSDYESVNITPTLEGRIKAHFKSICNLVGKAATVIEEETAKEAAEKLAADGNKKKESRKTSPKITEAVFNAYKAFVASPHREEIAAQHHEEINALSMQLSKSSYFRRAAFVLCHIPYHLRANKTYYDLVSYFGVPEDDAAEMLSPRKVGSTVGTTHPNFVQVAMTCCMCLDDRHASFKCDRLGDWLDNSLKLGLPAAVLKKLRPNATSKKSIDITPALLKAQVDGWCSSGPERLFSFHRFLIHNIDTIIAASRGHLPASVEGGSKKDGASNSTTALQVAADVLNKDGSVAYAFNKCITQLFATGQDQLGTKLLCLAPPEVLTKPTILRALKSTNIADSALAQFERLSEPAMWRESSRWAPMLLPADTCLVCFKSFDSDRADADGKVEKHTFHTCPEVIHLSFVEKIERTARSLLSVKLDTRGVRAAADFLHHCYLTYKLSTDMLRTNTSLRQVVLDVAAKCFVIREPQRGLRLMRRVPIQLVPVPLYSSLWKASGMTEDSVTHLEGKLDNLFVSYNLHPPTSMAPTATPIPGKGEKAPMRDFTQSPEFLRSFSQIVAGSLCRHCCHHGHHLTQCPYFRAEAALGRDMIAIFRVISVSESISVLESKRYGAKLIKFVLEHQYHMPYHILGVQRMVTGICASFAMLGEPGIALRVLLAIPASHRMRHNFLHVLHNFGVPKEKCIERMKDFVVTGDTQSSSTTNGGTAMNETRISPDHLVNHRPPIADVAMNLFRDIKGVDQALAEADGMILDLIAGTAQYTDTKTNKVKAKDNHRKITPVQYADVETLREAFMVIHMEVEKHTQMRLGSRHELFASGIEILEPNAAAAADDEDADNSSSGNNSKVHINVKGDKKKDDDLLTRTTEIFVEQEE